MVHEMNKKLLWLAVLILIVVILACGSNDPLASCFRRCEKLYGDRDNNPITPMINRDKYYECIDVCIIKYGYEK